jgi:hypothetical protein
MKRARFSLAPFSASCIPPGMEITGMAGRDAARLTVRYELRGPLKQFAIPASSDTPGRMDRLWENTCFEFFFSPKGSDQYWEFNLSPSGHWNVYRFSSYRKGMREERAFTALPFSVEAEPNSLIINLEANLSALIRSGEAVNEGISAVVRLTDGTLTYWALKHPGPRPDFHRRDGFLLDL